MPPWGSEHWTTPSCISSQPCSCPSQVCLLLFALYFSVAEVHTWRREGCARTARPEAWARWLLVMLTAATGLVRLAQLGIADRQWTRFVHDHPHHFTSFDQVAQLGSVARGLAASLLFLLLVKVRARGAAWCMTRTGLHGLGKADKLPPVHRLPSSCGLCASGLFLARHCVGRCQSSWEPPWAWSCLAWPMHRWPSW